MEEEVSSPVTESRNDRFSASRLCVCALCRRAACHRRRTRRRRRRTERNGKFYWGGPMGILHQTIYVSLVSQLVNHLDRTFPIGRGTQHREESFYASTPRPKLLFKSEPDLPLPQERKRRGTPSKKKRRGTGEAKHKHTDGRRSRSNDTHNLPTPSSDPARRRSVLAARVQARWTW